jgi:hypothetical protein
MYRGLWRPIRPTAFESAKPKRCATCTRSSAT